MSQSSDHLLATSSRITGHVTKLTSSIGYFQQNNRPCHKAHIITGLLNMTMRSTVLKCPLQSPVLSPIKKLWDVVDQVISF
ncbi:hypothetical protein DPEC_G00222150 [Dallia pectoralis]|uniref:Uncharacterized protein n=1 Tax=Dallia pectoralis TaxID=75939 RepID=A0ACC2G4C2_DALPE|nr:hypothetical protein DPEC_G00222150 [Dallia pectoralis]